MSDIKEKTVKEIGLAYEVLYELEDDRTSSLVIVSTNDRFDTVGILAERAVKSVYGYAWIISIKLLGRAITNV